MIYLILQMFFVAVLSFLIWCYLQKIKYKSLKDVPGPKPYPIIGNVLDIGMNSFDFFEGILRISKMYKPNAQLWLGPNQVYLISTDPDFMELILKSTKHIEKPQDYHNLKYFLHDGLLTAPGTIWHKRRKMLNSAFHPEVLKSNNDSFNDRTDALIDRLSKEIGSKDIEIYAFVASLTAEIISETSMGVCVREEQDGDYGDYYKHINVVTQIVMAKIFSYWKRIDFLFHLSSDYRTLQNLVKYGEDKTKSLIIKRREKLLNDSKFKETIDEIGLKKKRIFMDILLSGMIENKPLTDTEILEEVNTMIIAGIETTAILISFTLYELSRHADIQDKVYQEAKEIFGNNKNYHPTVQDYNNMTYLELVLKETLRLYPSIPFFGRQLQEDVNYNGTIIPKDTNLIFLVYQLHRREDLYPDAEKYDPERFATGRVSDHPYSYLPFSAGPRKCIGQKYAIIEAKCVISRLLMNFEVVPSNTKYDLKLYAQIMLRFLPGIFIQLKNRKLD